MGPRSEFASMIDDRQRRNILQAVFEGFYMDIHGDRIVVDTNRAWCSKLPLIDALYPDAKVIVCVRDLVWIVDSFERVLRKNALGTSKMFQQKDALTVHTRVNSLASPGGTVGLRLERHTGGVLRRVLRQADRRRLRGADAGAEAHPRADLRQARPRALRARFRERRLWRGRQLRRRPRRAGAARRGAEGPLLRAADHPAARALRAVLGPELLAPAGRQPARRRGGPAVGAEGRAAPAHGAQPPA